MRVSLFVFLFSASAALSILCSCSSNSSGSCYRIKDNQVYLHYYGGYPGGENVYMKMAFADPESFTFYKGSREGDCQSGVIFARDRNRVYYRNFIIESADPESFRPLGNGYSADKNSVYYKNKPVSGADVKSFFIIENINRRPWAADSRRLYFQGEPGVSHVDAETLEILHPPFFKDAENVYSGMNFIPLKGADPVSFISPPYGKIILRSFYVYDKNRGYHYEKLNAGGERITFIEGIDFDSFKVLNSEYAGDKNRIYYKGAVVEGADPETFYVPVKACPDRGRDKNHLYLNGMVVDRY